MRFYFSLNRHTIDISKLFSKCCTCRPRRGFFTLRENSQLESHHPSLSFLYTLALVSFPKPPYSLHIFDVLLKTGNIYVTLYMAYASDAGTQEIIFERHRHGIGRQILPMLPGRAMSTPSMKPVTGKLTGPARYGAERVLTCVEIIKI